MIKAIIAAPKKTPGTSPTPKPSGRLGLLISQEAKIQRFGPDTPMERYLIGATLMGFGSMLAGGCAVGAGMSGGSVFSLTAWLAVFVCGLAQ